MDVDGFAYLCWSCVTWQLVRHFHLTGQHHSIPFKFNTACITNNPDHTATASVHTFCQENYPTKPCVMHECLGMD